MPRTHHCIHTTNTKALAGDWVQYTKIQTKSKRKYKKQKTAYERRSCKLSTLTKNIQKSLAIATQKYISTSDEASCQLLPIRKVDGRYTDSISTDNFEVLNLALNFCCVLCDYKQFFAFPIFMQKKHIIYNNFEGKISGEVPDSISIYIL